MRRILWAAVGLVVGLMTPAQAQTITPIRQSFMPTVTMVSGTLGGSCLDNFPGTKIIDMSSYAALRISIAGTAALTSGQTQFELPAGRQFVKMNIECDGGALTCTLFTLESTSAGGTYVQRTDPYGSIDIPCTAAAVTVTALGVPITRAQTINGPLATNTTIADTDDLPYPVIIGGVTDNAAGGVYKSVLTDSSGRLIVSTSGGVTADVNLAEVAGSSTGLAGTGVAGAATQRVVEATTIIATAPTEVSVASTAGGTLVHTANANHIEVIIQNDENIVVSCGQTSAVTATGPGNKLKACTADDDGTGGSVTYRSGADVYCIAASGTAQVNVQVVSR